MGNPELSEYLIFTRDPEAEIGKKTEVWLVLAKRDGDLLGKVKWFGRWRQYAFFTEAHKVFNPACMADIATLCTLRTLAQRAKRRTKIEATTAT